MLNIARFKYMKVCIFILFAVAPLFSQTEEVGSISGTITNSSGDRISGVLVCIHAWVCALSDADGRYEVPKYVINSPFIRFSHPGYNTSIKEKDSSVKDSSDEKIDVILQKPTKESDNKRTIPHCAKNANLAGGSEFKIIIPSKDIPKSNDIDYESVFVPSSKNKNNKDNKGEYLMLMQTTQPTSGMPSWYAQLWSEKSPVIIYDRNIDYIGLKKDYDGILMSPAIDVKMRTIDGKFWRHIGDAGESMTYDNVSEETAREFDAILDTLCYTSPTAENHQ
jgi:hypothetical protein